MYQPVNSLAALSNFSKVPLALTGDALDAIDRGHVADEASLSEMFAQQQHSAARRPMELQQLGLQNQTAEAGLPGVVARSNMLRRQNIGEELTFDADMKAKLSELALKIPENEFKAMELQTRKLLMSMNPEEAAQGEKMWRATAEMRKLKQQHDWEMEQARLRNSGMLAAREASKPAPRTTKTFEDFLRSTRGTSNRLNLLLNRMAELDPNSEEYKVRQQQAENEARLYDAERTDALKRAAGGFEIGPDGKLQPATPVPLTVPGASTAAKPAFNVPPGAVEMLKKNPSLREAFDAKYGAGAAKQYLGN